MTVTCVHTRPSTDCQAFFTFHRRKATFHTEQLSRPASHAPRITQPSVLCLSHADPGPRNKLLERHLSRKAALGAVQLVLGVCGTVLLFYVPIAVACGESSSIALVTVSPKKQDLPMISSLPRATAQPTRRVSAATVPYFCALWQMPLFSLGVVRTADADISDPAVCC